MDGLFEMLIIDAVGIACLVWAVHVGNKVLTGRFEWLDRDAVPNKVCKFILAFTIGTLIGGFYLFWALFKWMARD